MRARDTVSHVGVPSSLLVSQARPNQPQRGSLSVSQVIEEGPENSRQKRQGLLLAISFGDSQTCDSR